MRIFLHVVAFCGVFSLLMTIPPAFAAEKLITAQDPAAILAVAQGYGRAGLTKDSEGDPLIECKMDGLVYGVVFYGCKNGANCESISLDTGWDENARKLTLDDVNDWNRRKAFAKAVLLKNGRVRLRFDILLRFGMTEKNLDACFDVWISQLKEFHSTVMTKIR